MGRKTVVLMPQSSRILQDMGNQIKLARLRRRISVDLVLVAERAGVSRASVWAVEKGSPSVAIGIYAAVLHGIDNMDRDLLKVAGDDKLGRTLQDLGLLTGRREKD